MKKFTFLIFLLFFIIGAKSQTSFTDDFNAGSIGTGWHALSGYGLSQSGGVLIVSAGTHTQNTVFTLSLGGNIDISSLPVVNLKMKTTTPCVMQVTLVDATDKKASLTVRIPVASDNLVNYCFDFTAITGITKSQIKGLEFSANPSAVSFGGKITFEDLIIGSAATKLATICPVNDVVVYKGKTAQKIVLTDIANATSVSVTGGTHIGNINVSAISAGVCTITYDCSSVGTDNITLTANGAAGFSNNTTTFNLTVEDNIAPTVDVPADIDVPVGKATFVKLTGISDGNASAEQTLTVSATSSLTASIPNPTVVPAYIQGSPYATLSINPTGTGTAAITVTVKDNGGSTDTKTVTFNVTSYNNFNNAPTINDIIPQSMYLSEGTLAVNLSGLSTGDAAGQNLTITAAGKHASVISAANVNYTQGNSTGVLTLTAAGLGTDTITVTVTDNGGGTSNGAQSAKITFPIHVLKPAPKGYVVPMLDFTADTAAKVWKIEEYNGSIQQVATYIDTLGSRCLRIQLSAKSTFQGLWYNLPEEFDLNDTSVISYEVAAKGFTPLITHVYFWDVDSQRNLNGATNQEDTILTNIDQFHTVFCDFRKPGNMIGGNGAPIKAKRIVSLLFNYHNIFKWPFTDISGTIYIRNIRIGNKCQNIPPVVPMCTANNIPTQLVWAGAGTGTISITGLSTGAGNVTGLTVTALSGKVVFIPHPTVGTIQASLGTDGKPVGTALLTYNILNSNVDSAKIVVNIKAPGSLDKSINFYIKTVSTDPAKAVSVYVDGNTKGQTMVGFGAMAPDVAQLDMYAKNQGCTMMRLTVDGDFEKANDNNDPNVLNRDAFDKSQLSLDYIRTASAAGVTDFFVTLWSPPAWMKQSLSQVGYGTGSGTTSTNKVDPMYYDEYVEFMVAIVRIIKEETGVEIAGFCPQNEPAFEEPYGSALLYPTPMAQVCGMLGKRLSDEGFKTKVINSEQVFSQGYYPVTQFIAAVKNDPLASVYNKVIGIHYPDANSAAWAMQWTACKGVTGNPQELWATECESWGNNWPNVMNQMQYMTVGMNNGCSAWDLWGYSNGSTGDEEDVTINGGNMMGKTGTAKHFWALKNYAKFVKKGSVQLKSISSNANVVTAAFKNDADTTMTIVLVNIDSKLPYSVRLTGSAPATGWDVYRTSFYEKCEKVNAFKNGLLAIPPKSITTITIKTNKNHAPTVDPVADMSQPVGTGTGVQLTGIGCGDPTSQLITITATSSDTNIMANPTVNYTNPKEKATLIVPAPKQGGSVIVTVILKDDGGRTNGGIDADTIKFTVNAVVGIKDVSEKVLVYPNPATEFVNVVLPAELSNSKLVMTNAAGQVLSEKKLTGTTEVLLNVSDLVPGSYFLRVDGDDSSAKLRFEKK